MRGAKSGSTTDSLAKVRNECSIAIVCMSYEGRFWISLAQFRLLLTQRLPEVAKNRFRRLVLRPYVS